MAQLPGWIPEVSDRLIDIQIAVEQGDQRRTISLIHETQHELKEIEREINGVLTTIRTGRMPRRMLRDVTLDANEAA